MDSALLENNVFSIVLRQNFDKSMGAVAKITPKQKMNRTNQL